MIVYVFSYNFNGSPTADMPAVDCRIITNPHKHASHDKARWALVERSKKFEPLVRNATLLLLDRGFVFVGCAWGKHRSVAVAREVARRTNSQLVNLRDSGREALRQVQLAHSHA